MLKTTFQQKEPKFFIYRVIKNFESDLQEALQSCKGSYDAFDNYFTSSLDKNTIKKKRLLWGTEKPHMNKNLRPAIMKRSKLKKKANKFKNHLYTMNYKRQVNYVRRFRKTAKIEFFNNLKIGKDNKPFLEKCKPYLTNKHSKADTGITLKENGELLLKDKDIADTFNKYFRSIVEYLDF